MRAGVVLSLAWLAWSVIVWLVTGWDLLEWRWLAAAGATIIVSATAVTNARREEFERWEPVVKLARTVHESVGAIPLDQDPMTVRLATMIKTPANAADVPFDAADVTVPSLSASGELLGVWVGEQFFEAGLMPGAGKSEPPE